MIAGKIFIPCLSEKVIFAIKIYERTVGSFERCDSKKIRLIYQEDRIIKNMLIPRGFGALIAINRDVNSPRGFHADR